MGVRITTEMLFRSGLADVTRARGRLARTQEQAASGLRVNRPSDDPIAVRTAALLRSGLDAAEQYQRNITQARGRVAAVESALADTNDLLLRARELAMAGANGTVDAGSRAQIGEEIETLHARLLANANARYTGGYVFGGFDAGTQPFSASGPFPVGAGSPTVAWGGDVNELGVAIDDGVTATVTLNGQRVFLGDANGDATVDAGRENLFDVLADLRDYLVTNDQTNIAGILPRIDSAVAQISIERTQIGATDTQLAQWEEKLKDRVIDLQKRLSDAQDADSVKVFSDLVQQQTALESSLQATSKLLQRSLLDFLE